MPRRSIYLGDPNADCPPVQLLGRNRTCFRPAIGAPFLPLNGARAPVEGPASDWPLWGSKVGLAAVRRRLDQGRLSTPYRSSRAESRSPESCRSLSFRQPRQRAPSQRRMPRRISSVFQYSGESELDGFVLFLFQHALYISSAHPQQDADLRAVDVRPFRLQFMHRVFRQPSIRPQR